MPQSRSIRQKPVSLLIPWVLDILSLALLGYLLVDRFDFNLLIQPTVMTGGDSASWYQIALYLKQDLIPQGLLMGWNQDNFLGYPEFQYYFILPFFLTVLLSYVIPLTVALKIVSVAGLLALPFAVYWALQHIQYRRPIPVIGAWISLIFLFHERFNMFGGNALSTLAGEFSYSFAFVLQVIFMATLIRGLRYRNALTANAILLAIIGLSHAFVFLTAALMPLYFWWQKDHCRANSVYLAKLYGLAFLLMAFWTLPMLAQLEFTTPIRMIWTFSSFNNFLSMLNYEVVAAAVIAVLTSVLLRNSQSHWQFFAYMILVSIILYLVASSLKIPDIRFFPPLLFFCLMLIVDGMGSFLAEMQYRRVPAAALLTLAILAGGSWLYHPDNNAPAWWQWNLSGFESKPAFNDGSMEQLKALLSADDMAPRVAWEKSAYNLNFGSDRVFESLPLFTGRRTLEGIHYSAALLSKPLSWLLGEYSLTAASPESLVYAHYNIDILPARFRMFNISDIIVRSAEMKTLLSQSAEFNKLGDAGELSVFRYSQATGGYVATPAFQPQLARLDSHNWKERYYAWFERAENLHLPIVASHFVSPKSRHLFPETTLDIDSRGQMQMHSIVPESLAPANVIVNSLNSQEISFHTDSPGNPHIIKVAYSPNWYSTTGESIFPSSPGLMLIYPEDHDVTLRYGRSNAEYIGLLLTVTGLLIVAWIMMRRLTGRPEWAPAFLERVAAVLCRKRQLLTLILLGLVSIAAIHSFGIKQHIKGDYQLGIQLNKSGDIRGAEQALLRASSDARIREFPQNPDIPHAMTALAWLYEAEKQDTKAMKQYKRLLQLYPGWIHIHQIHNGIAQLYERQGRIGQALLSFGRCAEIDQFSEVGRRCNEKYKELQTTTPGDDSK